jgi:hypothetical protein
MNVDLICANETGNGHPQHVLSRNDRRTRRAARSRGRRRSGRLHLDIHYIGDIAIANGAPGRSGLWRPALIDLSLQHLQAGCAPCLEMLYSALDENACDRTDGESMVLEGRQQPVWCIHE